MVLLLLRWVYAGRVQDQPVASGTGDWQQHARVLRLAASWGLRDESELQERLMAKRRCARGAGSLNEARKRNARRNRAEIEPFGRFRWSKVETFGWICFNFGRFEAKSRSLETLSRLKSSCTGLAERLPRRFSERSLQVPLPSARAPHVWALKISLKRGCERMRRSLSGVEAPRKRCRTWICRAASPRCCRSARSTSAPCCRACGRRAGQPLGTWKRSLEAQPWGSKPWKRRRRARRRGSRPSKSSMRHRERV